MDIDQLSPTLSKKESHASAFLSHIVAQSPQFIFWKDTQSVYLGCNQNYAHLVGLSLAEEIVGKTDYDLNWEMAGDSAELFRARDQAVLEGKIIASLEQTLAYNNTKIEVIINKEAIRDAQGKVIGVVGVATDVTERNRTLRMEQQHKETQTKLNAMRMLAASIAHELRTPLVSVRLAAAGIERYWPLLMEAYSLAKEATLPISTKLDNSKTEALANTVQSIQSEISAAMIFIDMLLMNLNNNEIDSTTFEKCHIREGVETAIARYPFTSDQQSLISFVKFDDFIYHGKSLLLIHVIFNLLKNALYFIQAVDKGKIYITVSANNESNILSFKDTGKGIPPDIMPTIMMKPSLRKRQTLVILMITLFMMQPYIIRCYCLR